MNESDGRDPPAAIGFCETCRREYDSERRAVNLALGVVGAITERLAKCLIAIQTSISYEEAKRKIASEVSAIPERAAAVIRGDGIREATLRSIDRLLAPPRKDR